MTTRASNNPSAPWILANAAGFAIGGAIAAVVVTAGDLPLVGTVWSQDGPTAALAPVTAVSLGLFGVLVGFAQWLILQRGRPITGWWIAATAGGWAAAGAITGLLTGISLGDAHPPGPQHRGRPARHGRLGGGDRNRARRTPVVCHRGSRRSPLVASGAPCRDRGGIRRRVPRDAAGRFHLPSTPAITRGLGGGRPPVGRHVRDRDERIARARHS
jgi:hypothetical protein